MENYEFGPVFDYLAKNNYIKIVLTMLLLSLCPLALPGWPVFSFYSIENEEFGPAFECSEFLRSFLEISQQSSCLPPVHSENFKTKF